MANNVEEALQEAISELKSKEYVIDVQYCVMSDAEEKKPCGYVAKLLHVMHEVPSGEGVTFSSKLVYINTNDFTYKWHYGGNNLESKDKFRQLLKTKFTSLKTKFSFDLIEIKELDEVTETAKLECLRTTSGSNAEIIKIKVWKKEDGTLDYRVIV